MGFYKDMDIDVRNAAREIASLHKGESVTEQLIDLAVRAGARIGVQAVEQLQQRLLAETRKGR